MLVKLLVVMVGSFFVTIGFFELLVRRIDPVRALFGMGGDLHESRLFDVNVVEADFSDVIMTGTQTTLIVGD